MVIAFGHVNPVPFFNAIPRRSACLFATALFFALNVCCLAQMGDEQPNPAVKFPSIKEVSPGIFQVGGVSLNKETKTATFPGTINMTRGLIEYLLVQEGGKTHESLLATKVEPYHLHVAMLLLGAKVAKPDGEKAPPDTIDAQYLKTAPKPKGDNVIIKVRWKDGDKDVEMNVEDLIQDDATKSPMSRGPWVYNGSMLSGGMFLAQEERDFAALVIDPAALINNTRPGSDNDQIWEIRANIVPKENTPVEISIQLQSGTAAPASSPAPVASATPKP